MHCHAHCSQGDVRSYADCERAVQQTVVRFGRLDIVVNCAAGNFLATAEELTSNGFRTGTLLLSLEGCLCVSRGGAV